MNYKCVCLVDIQNEKILLVKVRKNEKYYLPGGKIEKNEKMIDTLIRERKEN